MPERLSLAAHPEHYDLLFSINFDNFIFTVKQKTVIKIFDSIPVLRLHCEDLNIEALSLFFEDESVEVRFQVTDGELQITPCQAPLHPGKYELKLSFTGILNEDLAGFYKSRYIDLNGKEAYIATTQLEAPYARKVFPCFDEPLFKATFSVSLDIPEQMLGVSNMPEIAQKVENKRKSIKFATTPPMSTYLLYIGVGEFDYIEQKKDERTIRVYGVNGKSKQGTFALHFASDSLRFFEEYSGVPYPLPKLDLLAIPDFAAGAMENWGACTFREVLLYVDEHSTSLPVKKRIAEVIAHELWHQWSGNLVTMKWWDDLWLNEAFATYQAFRAVDYFFPEWHIWDDFLDGDTKSAFTMDMLSSTHSIAVPVHTPNEIEEIFDHISYGKGGSVLRMIEGYIGEEAFRKGVSAYLKKYSFQNAIAEDLWGTLEQHCGQPIKQVLIAWITKPGFPLLLATKRDSTLHLTQQRFTTNKSVDNELWPVPLTWFSENETKECLFSTRETELLYCADFIKINVNQTGFYRTLYDNTMYYDLCKAVKLKKITPFDRWGILDDLWAVVFAGHASLNDLLNVMDSYETEDQVFVLKEISALCTEISELLRIPENGRALFSRFRKPFENALYISGWTSTTNEAPHLKQLRSIAINFLIHAGDQDVKIKAINMAQTYLINGQIDPDLRGVCLGAISNEGSKTSFDQLKDAYEKKVNIEEKISLLGTLAEFSSPSLLAEYIDYALTDAIRRQDLRTVFSRVSHNPATPQIFFDWVKKNWSTLYEMRKSHFVYMGLLQTLITTAPDQKSLNDIREFLNKVEPGFEKTKANSYEKAQLYISFREREASQITI